MIYLRIIYIFLIFKECRYILTYTTFQNLTLFFKNRYMKTVTNFITNL